LSDTTEQTADEGGIEELRAELEKVKAKNKELITEKQKAKQQAQAALDAADEAAQHAAERNGDMEAIKAAHAKELQKLQAKYDALDGDLRTVRVDNEIARAITEGNVRPEMVRAVTAMMKAEVSYEAGVATIDGKPIADHATEYLGGKDGAHFVRPADNSGGGAAGATTSTKIADHGFTKDNFGQRMTEWSMMAKSDPELAKSIAQQVGRPDLASSV
jgi:phage I-like protein